MPIATGLFLPLFAAHTLHGGAEGFRRHSHNIYDATERGSRGHFH